MHEDRPSMTADFDPEARAVAARDFSLPAQIRLTPVLNSAAAAGLADRLLAVRGRPVQIDAGEVTQIGGLCLQVLLSAAKTWRSDKVAYALTPASQALRDQAALLGADLFSDTEGAVT
jgi:chemotaxis protein CheX